MTRVCPANTASVDSPTSSPASNTSASCRRAGPTAGTECTVFYIDFRAYGKGFDAYYERAQKADVRFMRTMPSAIKQDSVTENLEIQYALPDGRPVTGPRVLG